jgi:hypothetical protein
MARDPEAAQGVNVQPAHHHGDVPVYEDADCAGRCDGERKAPGVRWPSALRPKF